MTRSEVAAILADSTKRILGDISWRQHPDLSFSVSFRADVVAGNSQVYIVSGTFNRISKKLSYVLFPQGHGRIFGLCAGSAHHNPSCENVGDPHIHEWTDAEGDKQARTGTAIASEDPVALWKDFCALANIQHDGVMNKPPPYQRELFE